MHKMRGPHAPSYPSAAQLRINKRENLKKMVEERKYPPQTQARQMANQGKSKETPNVSTVYRERSRSLQEHRMWGGSSHNDLKRYISQRAGPPSATDPEWKIFTDPKWSDPDSSILVLHCPWLLRKCMDFLSKQGGRGEKEDEGGEGEKGEDHADEEGEEREMEWRATLTRQGGDYQARLVCDATHDTGLQGWKLIGVGLLVVHYVAKKQKWCVTMAPMGFALAPEETIPAVQALVSSLQEKCQDALAPGKPAVHPLSTKEDGERLGARA